MVEKLAGDIRYDALATLDDWAEVEDRDAIQKSFRFQDFSEAFGSTLQRRILAFRTACCAQQQQQRGGHRTSNEVEMEMIHPILPVQGGNTALSADMSGWHRSVTAGYQEFILNDMPIRNDVIDRRHLPSNRLY